MLFTLCNSTENSYIPIYTITLTVCILPLRRVSCDESSWHTRIFIEFAWISSCKQQINWPHQHFAEWCRSLFIVSSQPRVLCFDYVLTHIKPGQLSSASYFKALLRSDVLRITFSGQPWCLGCSHFSHYLLAWLLNRGVRYYEGTTMRIVLIQACIKVFKFETSFSLNYTGSLV